MKHRTTYIIAALFLLTCFGTGIWVATEHLRGTKEDTKANPTRIVIVDGEREIVGTAEKYYCSSRSGRVRLTGVTIGDRYYTEVFVLSGRVYVGGEK